MESSTLPTDLTVIFDLDGTLIDTAPDIIASLNVAFKEAGHAQVELTKLRPFVSRGARIMIEEALRCIETEAVETQVDVLLDRLLEDYWVNIDRFSRPYDGVIEVLEALIASGATLGVCTNKREAPALELLKRLDMLKYFPAVLGADSVPAHKPDPAHLTQTISRAGGNENRCVMIGDSDTDVKTAKAAGIPVIVVDFGYTDVPPENLGGDILVSHYHEIPGALAQLIPQV